MLLKSDDSKFLEPALRWDSFLVSSPLLCLLLKFFLISMQGPCVSTISIIRGCAVRGKLCLLRTLKRSFTFIYDLCEGDQGRTDLIYVKYKENRWQFSSFVSHSFHLVLSPSSPTQSRANNLRFPSTSSSTNTLQKYPLTCSMCMPLSGQAESSNIIT